LLLHAPGDIATWKRLLASGDTNPEALKGSLLSLAGMGRYATSSGCRHKSLVEFFGQKYERANCGACDVCLDEVELVDNPLVIAQKIVSCVVRLDQRYGSDYTAKVLVGSQEARILDSGHDKLSTYRLLDDTPVTSIRDWIEQLVGQGYLRKAGEYDVLQLTDLGAELLRGNAEPRLLKPAVREAKSSRTAEANWEGVDRPLFEHLRELRKQIAADESLPAYVVFGDTTLRELARMRPTSLETMAAVKGVGEKKLERYGQVFLDAIASHAAASGVATDLMPATRPPRAVATGDSAATGLAANAAASFELFAEGLSIDDVAARTGRARSTVVGYLNQFIQHESIDDPSPWVPSPLVRQIEDAIAHCGHGKLKPLFEHLGGQVDYDSIRIVATCLANRQS
jgi:ATP-dependent DNA helicase RecQ